MKFPKAVYAPVSYTHLDVMNKQRELIYGERNGVLDGLDLRDKIHGMMNEIIATAAVSYTHIDVYKRQEHIPPLSSESRVKQSN